MCSRVLHCDGRGHEMKAMILAAGRGERMRPLTDHTPKPLLEVGGKPLIVWHIERLAEAGFRELVINTAYLGGKIEARLGKGTVWGVDITYSRESGDALETGGGIRQALDLLGPGAFVVVNADVWTDYPFDRLPEEPEGLAHVVLVDNPPHHPDGDFFLENGWLRNRSAAATAVKRTFSGIGVYRPALFSGCAVERFPLAPLLRAHFDQGLIGGEHYRGAWVDVGAPRRLEALDRQLRGSNQDH